MMLSSGSSSAASRPIDGQELLIKLGRQQASNSLGERHTTLKSLKIGLIVSYQAQEISISWDERAQTFSAQQINVIAAMRGGSFTSGKSNPSMKAASDLAQKLNKHVAVDRQSRRADLENIAQLPGELHDVRGYVAIASHHNELGLERRTAAMFGVSSASASAASAASASEEEVTEKDDLAIAALSLEPAVYVSSLKAAAVSSTAEPLSLRGKPVLVYGFHTSYRKRLIEQLEKSSFSKMQKMNQYMHRVGIKGDEFSFIEYCNFVNDATEDGLEARLQQNVSHRKAICQDEAQAWASFLTRNISKLQFSHKLSTPEKRLKFFLKNCDVNKILNPHEEKQNLENKKGIEQAIKDNDWEYMERILNSVFDLLAGVGTDGFREELSKKYDTLSSDQKRFLNVILSKAFLRKTSKLGLTFAQEQHITVVFAWNASGEHSLEELHNLLEIKPYKYNPPQFRSNKQAGLEEAPEATTFSEMRELGRLKQKMNNSAPSYFLMREDSSNGSVVSGATDIKQSSLKGPGSSGRGGRGRDDRALAGGRGSGRKFSSRGRISVAGAGASTGTSKADNRSRASQEVSLSAAVDHDPESIA